ncbi:hypothetical protein BUALT_Bualt05G0050900 [Buddleja alternifolia]|uniref:Late embryogenesis abundant protein LEA-2 subgroup domain-containing protein n=1 Tax=Buddleja alternifolia TaxID=168488 RepID=A0AAV6XPN1_9LAMI|nr:hypothetical protein BUALT_Bualt05G0050900 [Buddleja alternifolia]
MAEKNQQQVQGYPLAPATIVPRSDEESTTNYQSQQQMKKKKRMKCLAYIAAFAVLQAIVILVIALVIIRVHTPRVRLGDVTVTNDGRGNIGFSARVSVRNRNFGRYRFDSSLATIRSGGNTVGQFVIPEARARVRSTRRVYVVADLTSMNATSGALTLTVDARLKGLEGSRRYRPVGQMEELESDRPPPVTVNPNRNTKKLKRRSDEGEDIPMQNAWASHTLRDTWNRRPAEPLLYNGEGEEADSDSDSDSDSLLGAELGDDGEEDDYTISAEELKVLVAPYRMALVVKILGQSGTSDTSSHGQHEQDNTSKENPTPTTYGPWNLVQPRKYQRKQTGQATRCTTETVNAQRYEKYRTSGEATREAKGKGVAPMGKPKQIYVRKDTQATGETSKAATTATNQPKPSGNRFDILKELGADMDHEGE